jgi:hypothetical protein
MPNNYLSGDQPPYGRVSSVRGGVGVGVGEAIPASVDGVFSFQHVNMQYLCATTLESERHSSHLLLLKVSYSTTRPLIETTLVIAKMDRLSRNAAFLLALPDSGVRFVAMVMPEANDLTVGIMALAVQAEREAISRGTREALAVAKARGVKLGNPNGAESLRRAGKGGVALLAAVSANAAAFAADLATVLADIRAAGHISLRSIAAELRERGIQTRRGGIWGVGNVEGLIHHLIVAS